MIPEKDIKILWARSGNRCALCRVELTHASEGAQTGIIGEMAHIVGKVSGSQQSPRSDSELPAAERNRYSNLLLLCRNDHKRIDDDPASFPADHLLRVKREHELWVRESLGGSCDANKEAADHVYGALIDLAIKSLHFDSWENWTHGATNPTPRVSGEILSAIYEFRHSVEVAVWPREPHSIPSLEAAIERLARDAENCQQRLEENCRVTEDNWYVAKRFYKEEECNPNYSEDLKKYIVWEDGVVRSFIRLCSSANRFAQEVRLHFNPLFRVERGKFTIRGRLHE